MSDLTWQSLVFLGAIVIVFLCVGIIATLAQVIGMWLSNWLDKIGRD